MSTTILQSALTILQSALEHLHIKSWRDDNKQVIRFQQLGSDKQTARSLQAINEACYQGSGAIKTLIDSIVYDLNPKKQKAPIPVIRNWSQFRDTANARGIVIERCGADSQAWIFTRNGRETRLPGRDVCYAQRNGGSAMMNLLSRIEQTLDKADGMKELYAVVCKMPKGFPLKDRSDVCTIASFFVRMKVKEDGAGFIYVGTVANDAQLHKVLGRQYWRVTSLKRLVAGDWVDCGDPSDTYREMQRLKFDFPKIEKIDFIGDVFEVKLKKTPG